MRNTITITIIITPNTGSRGRGFYHHRPGNTGSTLPTGKDAGPQDRQRYGSRTAARPPAPVAKSHRACREPRDARGRGKVISLLGGFRSADLDMPVSSPDSISILWARVWGPGTGRGSGAGVHVRRRLSNAPSDIHQNRKKKRKIGDKISVSRILVPRRGGDIGGSAGFVPAVTPRSTGGRTRGWGASWLSYPELSHSPPPRRVRPSPLVG